MIGQALVSLAVLAAWFIVPAAIVAVAMRSSVVTGAVDSWLDQACPDCGADAGEPCHVACSSHWN